MKQNILRTEIYLSMYFSRYIASGCSFHDLHFSYRIGISTARKIFKAKCLSIWSIMLPECIPKPTKEQWELNALEFEKWANFPHCLGAVDGKYILVIKPEHRCSMFFNYKEFFSVVLKALSKNLKIKIYRSIILPVVLYGCETWSLTLREERSWGCLRIGCWGEYFALRGRRWQGNGESCITRSWMICTPYPILCGW